MRKRSKYRPKQVRADTVGYVLKGMTPMVDHGSEALDWKINNHGAMLALSSGAATSDDIKILITMCNVAEGLQRLGIGTEFSDEIKAAADAVADVVARKQTLGRYTVRATELDVLNAAINAHDTQLEDCTVADMEKAKDIVRKVLASGNVKVIVLDTSK